MPATESIIGCRSLDTDRKNPPLIFRNYVRWPLLILMVATVFLSLLYIFIMDPMKTPGAAPTCYIYSHFGIYCPGCGNTRALHALVHGHIPEMFGYNLLFPFAVIILAWYFLVGFSTLLFRKRVMWIPTRIPTAGAIGIGVAVVLFTVLRNIPVWPFTILAP